MKCRNNAYLSFSSSFFLKYLKAIIYRNPVFTLLLFFLTFSLFIFLFHEIRFPSALNDEKGIRRTSRRLEEVVLCCRIFNIQHTHRTTSFPNFFTAKEEEEGFIDNFNFRRPQIFLYIAIFPFGYKFFSTNHIILTFFS